MTLPSTVSQRDIAEHLGIAVSTVSRALNNNPRVSRLTRRAVQRAVQELATRNDQDRDSSSLPMMVGITHSHSFHGRESRNYESLLDQVLGGVEDACRPRGAIPYPWQKSHLLTGHEADVFFDRVSGVIMSGGEVDGDLVKAIKDHGRPIIIIGGHLPGADMPSVASNNHDGLYVATQHLIKLGHRRIALINGPDTTYTSQEKKSGFLTALVDAGVPFHASMLVSRDDRSGFSDGTAEDLTREMLSLKERPTALLFATDSMARAGYRVCQELGLSIPRDVSIVGFHDDDAAFAYPPLTTVRVNRFEWGVVAVEQLMQVVAGGPSRTSRLLLPVQLIIRESTAPPGSAVCVSHALEEVIDHG
jgi:DNA-binding LacI/PurR family transcriptional regulator